MVNAKQMKNGRLPVMNVNAVVDDIPAVRAAFTILKSSFQSSTGHPQAESTSVMIPAVSLGPHITLSKSCSTEFTPEDNQSIFEQPALLQVFN